MLKENRIKILNYSFLIIAVILSFGGVSTCCLSYGHGLGDILYLFPLWLLTFIYFILVVFLKRKIKESIFVPIIFGIILSFFIVNIFFNKGPECSCNFFNIENDVHFSTVETVESLDIN